MNNKLKEWLSLATPAEREKLAKEAQTSVGTLRQIAGGYRTDGVVSATPESARRIEFASKKIKNANLPELRREDLCLACKNCEYPKKS